MPKFVFQEQSPVSYVCKTEKGSNVVIYRNRSEHLWDWFISKDEKRRDPYIKPTDELREQPAYTGVGFMTKEEAAEDLLVACNRVYGSVFNYKFIGGTK